MFVQAHIVQEISKRGQFHNLFPKSGNEVYLTPFLHAPDGSNPLLNADQVARGIADGTVANTVRLRSGLLDNLGTAGLDRSEGRIQSSMVASSMVAIGALGHHLGDGAALVIGNTRAGGRRVQRRSKSEGWSGRAEPLIQRNPL